MLKSPKVAYRVIAIPPPRRRGELDLAGALLSIAVMTGIVYVAFRALGVL